MATFRKRANSWQARVQRHGHPDLSKSFKSHVDAVAWARKLESDIDYKVISPHAPNYHSLSPHHPWA